jgi:hypothetical protein
MRSFVVAALLIGCASKPAVRGDGGWDATPKDAIDAANRELTASEKKLLAQQGFAILERGEATSFHVGYTALFKQHAPVYVTADSMLYAWHSSYDAILMDVEQAHLIPAMNAMLGELRKRLAESKADAAVKADLDTYLTVAASFTEGKPAKPVAGGDAAMIAQLVQLGEKAEGLGAVTLFGDERQFDFSMLKPRGHYDAWIDMEQYFRAMSWLGRVEFEIAYKRRPTDRWTVNRRALKAAMLLGSLFDGGGPRDKWKLIDDTVGAFVGPRDSMTLPGLASAIAALGGNADAPDADVIAAFAKPSVQRIRTQVAKAGAESLSFVTLGQRFAFDSKVLSDLTYGSLATNPPRLMPTPLDVAHAVFGNPAAGPLLQSERQRFGTNYVDALATALAETAKPDPALWNGSLYHGWLGALRTLSPDKARDAGLPAPLASDAWARRMMQTQLASWAELRHDNLLYAKQSFSGTPECEFPDAYVEPYPAFFAAMSTLAKRGRATIGALPASPRRQTIEQFFDGMAATMEKLRAMAERQRANEPLLAADLDFLNRMVSINGRHGGCVPTVEPQGWYADLYYDKRKIMNHEPVIADVHTQPADEAGNPVGHVLHVGTRAPRMLVARLQHDGGKHAQTYRGFVSTYAETITRDFKRYTDEEWVKDLGAIDSTPAWLRAITAR